MSLRGAKRRSNLLLLPKREIALPRLRRGGARASLPELALSACPPPALAEHPCSVLFHEQG